MKLALPVNQKDMLSNVSTTFGRTSYFFIYDTDSKEGLFLDNLAAQSSGGAGVKAAQSVVDSNANVLITPRCGENAANVLKAAKIELFQSVVGSLEDNIKAYESGKLKGLLDIHEGYHHRGGH